MASKINFNNFINPEFDYTILMSLTSGYVDPWGRISRLLKSGEVIRVKKGIYVLGDHFERPYSKFVLANLLYGPSYVSFSSALAYYGLIPEATSSTQSVTSSRKKQFKTPLGDFEFIYQNIKLFSAGMNIVSIDENKFVLIATPEKALLDAIQLRFGNLISKQLISPEFLIEDMRIEEERISKLSTQKFEELAKITGNKLAIELENCVRSLR